MDAYDKVIRAKVQLQRKRPFFSYLLIYMVTKEDNSLPTIGVDKFGHLFYNKSWVETLDEFESEGVLIHEVLHVALGHMDMRGHRNATLFKRVNDLIVNDICVSEGITLPKGGLIPDRNHSYRFEDLNYTVKDINKKSSEELYSELIKIWPKDSDTEGGTGVSSDEEGGNHGGFDVHIISDKNQSGSDKGDGKGGNELTQEQMDKINKENSDKWRKVLTEATVFAKQRGVMPAGMERLVDEILESKIDWLSKLSKFIIQEIPYDYSWNSPSKKSISCGVYLPSVLKEKIEMVLAIDTSGSIDGTSLKQCVSEVWNIAKSFEQIEMYILICDAKVHHVYKVENGNLDKILRIKCSGGGGTSHVPVVEWIKKEKPDTKLLIALTDGYSDIENCFNELNCHKIIVLPPENSVHEDRLKDYGEVVKIK